MERARGERSLENFTLRFAFGTVEYDPDVLLATVFGDIAA